MPLKSIQLCTIDPRDRAAGKFDVTAHADDGDQHAIFECDSEADALRLRTAIRDHAARLRRVADYRPGRAVEMRALLDACKVAERILDSVAFVARPGDTVQALRLLRAAIAGAEG